MWIYREMTETTKTGEKKVTGITNMGFTVEEETQTKTVYQVGYLMERGTYSHFHVEETYEDDKPLTEEELNAPLAGAYLRRRPVTGRQKARDAVHYLNGGNL